jgi:hypothetical protein
MSPLRTSVSFKFGRQDFEGLKLNFEKLDERPCFEYIRQALRIIAYLHRYSTLIVNDNPVCVKLGIQLMSGFCLRGLRSHHYRKARVYPLLTLILKFVLRPERDRA